MLLVCYEKGPHFCGPFVAYLMMAAMVVVVSAAEPKAASAEAEAYARTAITISVAIIGLGNVVSLRSIVGPPRCVVTIAPVMAVVTMTIVTTMRTEVRRLARHIGCGFRLGRTIRGVCCGTSKHHGCADRKNDT